MSRSLTLEDDVIAEGGDCYVIAEIGHNHQGSVEKCKKLFDAAKECGCNAVKLQKRDNRHLYTKEMYDQPYNSENAYAPTYGAHREALEFDKSQYRELQDYARHLGITMFATAFDFPSADFLAELDMPAYKIASGDLTNIPLMKYVASLGKPVIISSGGGTLDDVRRAYEAILPVNSQLGILHCTSGYPCEYEEMNLRVIETYRREFGDAVIGLSCHDTGISMAVVGYVLGAQIVEKHFTLNRTWKGTDQAFSLEPTGMRKMVRDLRRVRPALGDGVKRPFESEKGPLTKMAKKLVAARALPAGHVVAASDIAIKSPGDGLAPYFIDDVIGGKLTRALVEDEGFRLEDLA